MSDCFEVLCVHYVGQGWRDRLQIDSSAEMLRLINFSGQNSPAMFFTLCSSQAAIPHGLWAQVLDHLPKGEIDPDSCWKGNSCGLVSVCALKNRFFLFFNFFLLCIGELFKDGLCCCCVLCPFAWVRGDISVLSSSYQAPWKVWTRLLSLSELQYLISCGKLCPFSPYPFGWCPAPVCIAKPEMLMGYYFFFNTIKSSLIKYLGKT